MKHKLKKYTFLDLSTIVQKQPRGPSPKKASKETKIVKIPNKSTLLEKPYAIKN